MIASTAFRYCAPLAACAVAVTAAWPAAVRADETGGTSADRSCIEVGTENGWIGRLDCLNLSLRALSKARQAQVAELYGSSGSVAEAPPAELGLYDQFGAAERLGSNFGHSARPQRPPPPVWTLPFGPGK